MYAITLPNGETIMHEGPRDEAVEFGRIPVCRYLFTLVYMELRGWGTEREELTVGQMLEIQAQPGWRRPVLD